MFRKRLGNYGWSSIILLLAVAGAPAAELRVGRAAVNITPAVGTPMGSSYGLTISQGVHDDLYAKALVLEKDGVRAALVACDLISLRPPVVAEARRRIESSTGLRAEQVILSAIHTHCGPQMHTPFLELLGGEPMRLGEQYRAALPGKIAESVRQALADLKPARAWVGMGREPSLSFNRRYLMTDGTVVMNPGALNPKIVRPAGGIDPDVGVVYFDSPAGDALATYVNFPMHVAVNGGARFSADFPAVMADLLARIKGRQMLTLFTMGAAGDINHLDTQHRGQLSGYPESRRIGTILAGEVLKTYARLRLVDTGPLQYRMAHLKLPVREPAPSEPEKARALFARYGKPGGPPFLDVVWAWRVLELAELKSRPLEVDVPVMTLGDQIAWVGLPGEHFVDLGLAIKRDSLFPFTLVSGMSGSGTISYVPTRRAFVEGSYEVLSSRVAPGGGEVMADAAIQMLRALFPRKN